MYVRLRVLIRDVVILVVNELRRMVAVETMVTRKKMELSVGGLLLLVF